MKVDWSIYHGFANEHKTTVRKSRNPGN
jgi:hypothetical protein